MTSAFSWQNSVSLCPAFIPYSKAKFACYSRCFLTSYFCTPVPYNEKGIFWVVSFGIQQLGLVKGLGLITTSISHLPGLKKQQVVQQTQQQAHQQVQQKPLQKQQMQQQVLVLQ